MSVLLISSAAYAQTGGGTSAFPAKGQANYVTYYTGRPLSEIKVGDASFTPLELVGITRNPDGQAYFDQMAVRCLGTRQVIGGAVNLSGFCTETDRDGDVVVTTYEAGPQGGTHTIVDGTGKYQGIKGTAPYTFSGLKPPGPGMSATAVEHKASWEIKK